MRRIIYKLGLLSLASMPLIAAGACGKNANKITIEKQNPVPTFKFQNITIDVRIPNWDQEVAFDQTQFDQSKYIEEWHYVRRQPIHNMVPYVNEYHLVIPSTNALTLGGIMDEINGQNADMFKFNLPLAEAGNMGRFLSGVKKSTETITQNHIQDLEHEGYWGIHFEDNGHNTLIQTDDDHYSYLALASPNSSVADQKSHEHFERNESFYFYDGRLPKGVDGIELGSNDIYQINLWRMM